VEWRKKLESRFVFRPQPTDVDAKEIASIRSSIASKGAACRKELLAGPANVRNALRRIEVFQKTPDPVLTQIHSELEQLKCDLSFLGITPPPVSSPLVPKQASGLRIGQPPAAPPQAAPSVAPSSTGPFRSAPSCPRCSSVMVRRVAFRGRNVGGTFWGCSRYPTCRGSRPIWGIVADDTLSMLCGASVPLKWPVGRGGEEGIAAVVS